MGLAELLERYVPTTDKRCIVPHALALGVLLRSIVVEREPLYRQGETAHGFASELFGLSAQQMAHLSDDRIGRALDRLFDADRSALLTEVKEQGKLDGVRVAAMMQSTVENAGLPRYTSWVIVSAHVDWEKWAEWRLVVGRQRAEMTERGFRVPDKLAALTEEKLADIGPVDIACVPIGGSLSATRAGELVAQLDPRIVIPMAVCEDETEGDAALARFFHEMGATPVTHTKLSITPSALPDETTTVVLEARGKTG